jgi:hypothetical protein
MAGLSSSKAMRERVPLRKVRENQSEGFLEVRDVMTSAASRLAGWFGLFRGLRLSARGAIAVKQNAVRSQIAD